MSKVIHVVGARPQFIKYHPIAKVFADQSQIESLVIHTGQHYDHKMSGIFTEQFAIGEPDYFLGVGSGSHGQQTAKIISKVEEVLLQQKPDAVILYGDTNSTLGGAIAAAKLDIPIAHVEAGLRSFNKKMPEEINRIMTDHVSSLLLCPTERAVANLKQEGFCNVIADGKLCARDKPLLEAVVDQNQPLVINVGDVMYDLLLQAIKIADHKSNILTDLDLQDKNYLLLTLHRAENTDDIEKFTEIVEFINHMADQRTVIYPMHPRTSKVYQKANCKFRNNIRIIEPVGYFEILVFLQHAELVITDSGGMQKEAFWLQVPTVTLREETEWLETIESGWNILYRNYQGHHSPQAQPKSYYGDGKAAQRIASAIVDLIM